MEEAVKEKGNLLAKMKTRYNLQKTNLSDEMKTLKSQYEILNIVYPTLT